MKKLFLLFTITILFTIASNAQNLGKINPDVQKQIGDSLTKYYSLKNSLVASNVDIASQRADELIKLLEAVDASKMTAAQKTLWEKLAVSLKLDSQNIKENKEIELQRENFVKLSNNMYSLVFNFKANQTEAYLQYCPMKKASWLSDSKDIRNPYYGDKMIDCGSVKATLKKR